MAFQHIIVDAKLGTCETTQEKYDGTWEGTTWISMEGK